MKKMIVYEPQGIVFLVKPFNFPFIVPLISALPALMAGNKVLLKPPECCPQVGLKLAEVFKAAGLEGYFETGFVPIPLLEKVISDPRVKGVHVTGHKNTGKIIASLAGKYMKKIVCELGGSDPFVVLDDANLENAVESAIRARLTNTGQICICAKRFLVHESLYDQFVEKVVEKAKTWEYGDPLQESTRLGPMARQDFTEGIDALVQKSIQEGASLKLGGHKVPNTHANYEVTVLADVQPDQTCFTNETFGPVFSITKASTNDELIRLANQSEYGLAASLWTQDPSKASQYVPQIQAGSVGVN